MIGSKSAYARHRRVSPAMVTKWIHAGAIVLDQSGRAVDFEASDAALARSSHPFKGGKNGGGRPPRQSTGGAPASPASSGEKDVSPRDDGQGLPGARPTNSPSGSGFIQSKTRQTDLGNALLELKLKQAQKELVPRREYDGGFVEGLEPALAKLRGIAVRIAPEVIAAGGDIRKVQEIIEAAIERTLEEASETVAALIAAPEASQQ